MPVHPHSTRCCRSLSQGSTRPPCTVPCHTQFSQILKWISVRVGTSIPTESCLPICNGTVDQHCVYSTRAHARTELCSPKGIQLDKRGRNLLDSFDYFPVGQTCHSPLLLDRTTVYHQELTREITECPHAPSGVAAFMSAHSKTPYITLVWIFPLGMG